MAECRCSVLYQFTKCVTQSCALSTEAEDLWGKLGRYFSVRKRASEKTLSSETRGRLKDGVTPSHCRVARSVAPFIGPPLSECSTRPSGQPASAHDSSCSHASIGDHDPHARLPCGASRRVHPPDVTRRSVMAA
ncbi:hypothetical protein MFUL124B02_11865 [Myxococcus fulvus 124B02]|nr:hypothetical protein MFUL124B02_11865 [Myxococcus fulvus 124B02]